MTKDKNSAEERRLRARTVGEFLKTMRQKAGLTQQELAGRLAYSTAQFVSNWERGVSLPPMEALPKIATLCRITPRNMVEVLFDYQEEALKLQKKKMLVLLTRATRR